MLSDPLGFKSEYHHLAATGKLICMFVIFLKFKRVTTVPPLTLGLFFLDIQKMTVLLSICPWGMWREMEGYATCADFLKDASTAPWQACGKVLVMAADGKTASSGPVPFSCHQNKARLGRAWEWDKCKLLILFHQ